MGKKKQRGKSKDTDITSEQRSELEMASLFIERNNIENSAFRKILASISIAGSDEQNTSTNAPMGDTQAQNNDKSQF